MTRRLTHNTLRSASTTNSATGAQSRNATREPGSSGRNGTDATLDEGYRLMEFAFA
jgi:hypothetical protein